MSDRKINILFVLPNFHTGGSEKLVFDIIRNVDKKKFSPVLCVFFSGEYEEEFLKLGLPFYEIHENGIRSKFGVCKFLSDIVRKHKIDVVNTHHTSSLVQGVLPFRVLNKVHFWAHTEHTRLDIAPNMTKWILSVQKICLNFVDVFIGISQGVCDYFEKDMGVPGRKIVKILNGIDIKRFQITEEESKGLNERYRKELKINIDDVVIGLFANFREQKNHKCLIKAASILRESGISNFRIVLAGVGPLYDQCRVLATEIGAEENVMFLGCRLDIPELMNMIDIYCLPSFFEGLPLSLMEAMAAKKVVVASDVIGNNEIACNDKNAVLFKSDSESGLAAALKNVIRDRQDNIRLSNNAFQDIQEYNFENMMKAYDGLFSRETKI